MAARRNPDDDLRGRAPAEADGKAPAEATPSRERTKKEGKKRAKAKDERVQGARTPPDPTPLPEATSGGRFDLWSPRCYLNRELTWLNFNYRVLQMAEDAAVPLLERLRFVAIVSSNLDEFFMKRIGGLKQQEGAAVQRLTVDGRTPRQQIEACLAVVADLEALKRRVLQGVLAALADAGVVVAQHDDLSKEDRELVKRHYLENIYPLVTPQATDPAHPFPFISNLSLNLLVALSYPGDPDTSLARVKVPVGAGIDRFLRVGDKNVFVPLESVMAAHLDRLFPGMEIHASSLFRVTRNANTEIDEERAEDLLSMIETGLRERKFAPIVRMQVQPGMNPVHRGMLAAELGLDERLDVAEVEGMLGMRDLMQLTELALPSLKDPPHHPIDAPQLLGERNVFHILRQVKSVLVHHPYESFSTSVERFLREASRDPKVRAIKMTIYRTGARSKPIEYLIDAARNGKQVAVAVELKARFDEAANIRWANRLEEAGIHVNYGVMGLKTHCKAILVLRHDYDGLRRYAHLGTGNYHAGTARLYSDLGLFTCDPKIGEDLTELFNYLTTGYKPKRNYKKLLPAPKQMKPALLEKIEREAGHAKAGREGRVQMKMNALEDAEITRALYRASQAGVHVDLVVRDTCRLRPGIPGLSENVRVVSVLGRFLEHARIYRFLNDGSEEVYIGSADCMTRNLDSRVEVLVPVEDPEQRAELAFLLETQLDEGTRGWLMQPDGSYVERRPESGREPLDGQEALVRRAEERLREATRLKRRKARGGAPRKGHP